jgi:hypothetical protein
MLNTQHLLTEYSVRSCGRNDISGETPPSSTQSARGKKHTHTPPCARTHAHTHGDRNAPTLISNGTTLVCIRIIILDKQSTTQQYIYICRHTQPYLRNTTVAHLMSIVPGSRCNRDVPHSVGWSTLQQQLVPHAASPCGFNNDSLVTSAK